LPTSATNTGTNGYRGRSLDLVFVLFVHQPEV
jgi:hypothetical protein